MEEWRLRPEKQRTIVYLGMKQTRSATKLTAVKKSGAVTKTKKRRIYREPTARQLERAAREGIKKAAEETMRVTGFNVIAKDGWVVKVFADGKENKLSELPRVKKPTAKQLAKI
jgi:hypothetical protein